MAQLKDTLIAGDLRVTGTIYGLTSNANQVLDYNDNKPTKFGYSTSAVTSASWIGAWDASTTGEYRLRAISPQKLRNAMGLGDTTSALPVANGGTGATTASAARSNLGLGSMATETATNYILKSTLSGAYDVMYSSSANTPTRLAANTTSTMKFLSMKGTGSAGAAPTWAQPAKYGTSLPSSGDFVGQIFVLTE